MLLQSDFTGERQGAFCRRDRSPCLTECAKCEASTIKVLEKGRNAVGILTLSAASNSGGCNCGIAWLICLDDDMEGGSLPFELRDPLS